MINLITGLPGNGKTLYALSLIKNISEKDSRPVFYSGITDLKLPWTEINPEKWFEAPPGSIVVIDECQRVFRPRTISKDVPDYVAQLETHRHLGIDLYLITQHPMLADSAIRRLVGNHRHVVRTFGTQRATIHEWGSVKDTCDKTSGRSDSIKHKWGYDKKAFDYYKSAELHTVKRNIPARLYFLIGAPFLIALAVLYMWKFTDKQIHPKGEKDLLNQPISSVPPALSSASSGKAISYKNAVEDAKQYVFAQTARVDGLPHTAPKYDEITAPTVAPVPVGCMATKTKCFCYSQQATPISMPDDVCYNIVKNGFFQDFDVQGKSKKEDHLQKKIQPIAKTDDISHSYDRVSVMPYDAPKPVSKLAVFGVSGDMQTVSPRRQNQQSQGG
ncbi:hypothetical protein BH11PSE12_BH11PSE12_27150 [soil metagenome]